MCLVLIHPIDDHSTCILVRVSTCLFCMFVVDLSFLAEIGEKFLL